MNQTQNFEDLDDTVYQTTAFILEGILLLIIAIVGLAGNLMAIFTILSQKVQKTFHDLLLVLTVFDMVCTVGKLKLFYNSYT